jgi:glutaredoxin
MVTIKINNIEDFNNKYKLQKNSIYLFTMSKCPYCKNMKKEWNKAKKKNINFDIYEIKSTCINLIPKILKKHIFSYPTILKYNNNKNIKIFEKDRIMSEFDNFIKN